jgi:Concanavalin A-like lectin/glucanases superfamily/PEP-CTERM motif
MMNRFAWILAAGLAIAAATPAHADLVAYWSADGTAVDSSGNGHNGTLENGAGYGPGKIGEAFALNGANQYVSVPASNDWAFGSGSFTIGLWANFNTIESGGVGSLPNTFIGADDGGGNQDKWVFSYNSSGSLVFHINSPGSGPIFLSSPDTFTPTLGTWNYYAVTRSGDTFTFYVNGTSLGTVTNSTAVPTVIAAPLTIGEAEGAGYFNGSLDEIRIYNNALTASQIAQLASVPEPSSLLLGVMGIGVVGCLARSRRNRR